MFVLYFSLFKSMSEKQEKQKKLSSTNCFMLEQEEFKIDGLIVERPATSLVGRHSALKD